jgi:hypothetical protein
VIKNVQVVWRELGSLVQSLSSFFGPVLRQASLAPVANDATGFGNRISAKLQRSKDSVEAMSAPSFR